MLNNLKKLLDDKGITYKDFAEFLDISEKTSYSKLNGKTDFTLSEITKIWKFLFPEYTFEYLFATDKTA